jgi:POLQ-like helicase
MARLDESCFLSSLNDSNSLVNKYIQNNLFKNVSNYMSIEKIEDDQIMKEDTQTKRLKHIDDWQMNSTPVLSNPKIENFYELPNQVGDTFKKLRNIEKLYDWQDECLRLECLNEKNYSNLLYIAPTSGGKTLIAEIAILKCLLLRKKNCIFIMPFVSIVQEKVKMMKEFAENFDFYCEEYAGVKGKLPPIKRRGKQTLFICTIEKANGLINSLIELNRLESEIGLVVADEMHMVGDGPRGAIFEILLTKIIYKSKKAKNLNEKIQIVATTATLDNKKELAKYLNAHLFEKNFRPIELKEYVKYDKDIYLIDSRESDENKFKKERSIDFSTYHTDAMRSADPDFLIGLVLEVIPSKSCLIFCSTKRNCENVATLLATHLPKHLTQYKRDQKLALYNELRAENSQQICPILRKTIPHGISYHHSGLTSEERQLIEQAYKDGVLCIITCTSTLAAGVNLPAKRVIIRSPYVGQNFLTTHQYRQMIGFYTLN